jgi:hypothetical protein
MFKLFNKKKEIILSEEEQLRKWEAAGKPAPPPHVVKQKAIMEYKQKFGTEILIETGTYLGDMVYITMDKFKQVYSIELSKKLHAKAVKRFKNNANVFLHNGDSGIIMPNILKNINAPCLFWLDGHYSGGITAKGNLECPVREELDCILKHSHQHVVLIDDARLFNGTNDYPSLSEIENIIAVSGKKYTIAVDNDIIRLT